MSAVAISAADVNKLRQITGAGMMDCKNALTEAVAILTKPSRSCVKKAKKWPTNAATAKPPKATP